MVFSEDFISKLKEISKHINSEKIADAFKNKNIIEAWVGLLNEISVIFQSKDGLIAAIEALKSTILNGRELLLKNNTEIDADLFRIVEAEIQQVLAKDPIQTKAIYLTYKNSLKSKFPLENLTNSLLFYQKNLPDLYKLMSAVTVEDFSKKINDLFEKILNNSTEEDFKSYVFDWLLKFGYLIEGYIVDILRAELKCKYLMINKTYTEKQIINKRFVDLLNELNEDHTLRQYRNAIFHTSFVIRYEIDPKERKIIYLANNNKNQEISIRDFVNSYYALLRFVQTYRYAFTYAVPLEMREDGQKQVLEMLDQFLRTSNNKP